jgi:hypothetical protein
MARKAEISHGFFAWRLLKISHVRKKGTTHSTGALDQLAKQCNQDWLLIYAHLLRTAKAHCTATLDSWNKNGVQYYDVRVHYFDLGDPDDPSAQ